jgi:hypothetical protein
MYDLNDVADQEIKVVTGVRSREKPHGEMRDTVEDAKTPGPGTATFTAPAVVEQSPSVFVATHHTVNVQNDLGDGVYDPPSITGVPTLNFSAPPVAALALNVTLNSSPNFTSSTPAVLEAHTTNFTVGGALLDPCVGRCGSTPMATSEYSYA